MKKKICSSIIATLLSCTLFLSSTSCRGKGASSTSESGASQSESVSMSNSEVQSLPTSEAESQSIGQNESQSYVESTSEGQGASEIERESENVSESASESQSESEVGSTSEEETTSEIESESEEESTHVPGMITASPLTAEMLGAGFDSTYLPDASSIKQQVGKIDVCLDFEGTEAGWRALADEYERLHGDAVVVNIDTTYAGPLYTEKLNSELTAPSTDWDIIDGSLGYINTERKCVDMYSLLASKNPYCGIDVRWGSVLNSAAYKSNEADNRGRGIVMNTEQMQTCWFVNEVALEEAVALGYKNADGLPSYPVTWDDLISLCEYIQQAGYTNPLGISLCNASVEDTQFSWLLRVYGDYYYRQFYKYIMLGGEYDDLWEIYSATENVPENLAGYYPQYAKILSILFDRETPLGCGYVGFESALYRDFVGNLAKMNGFLTQDSATVEFAELRDRFLYQYDSFNSPQILLDYQGFGISYERADVDGFRVGYFDYPTMTSKYVPEDTITRDIGGNGGFISAVQHIGNAAQTDLNKDFVKFVLSPYGQTIYYKGLANANKVPKGLSTVKNELVVIPSEWVEFFERSAETVRFNGCADANVFLSWGVRDTGRFPNAQNIMRDLWGRLLIPNAYNALTVNSFAAEWGIAVEKDAHAMTTYYGWSEKIWKDPYYMV